MKYDFTRYVFTTTDPKAIAPLVGTAISGCTKGWGYFIESFEGKRGIARELRDCPTCPHSLKDLPMCLVDYMSIHD